MASNEIAIVLKGDSSALVKAMLDAGKSFNGIVPYVNNTINSVSKLKKAVSEVTSISTIGGKSFRVWPGALKVVDTSFKDLTKSSGSAVYAMTNVSRVLQDAPFGFVGIANNIEPLLGSFRSLVAESGGVKGAMTALGSSLMGGGGLMLAVGAVSFAMSTFGDKLFGSGEKAKAAKEELEKYKKMVEGLNEATSNARADALGEIADVKRLGEIVSDSTKSYAIRKRALEELGQINQNYFGELKLETLQYGTLESAVNRYSSALVNLKIKEKLAGQIADARIEQVKAQKEFDKLLEKVNIREGDIRANVFTNTNVRYRFDTGNTGDAPTKLFEENLNKARNADGKLKILTKQLNEAGDKWGMFTDLVNQYSVDQEDALMKTLELQSTSINYSKEEQQAAAEKLKLLKEEAKLRAQLAENLKKIQNDILDNDIRKLERSLDDRKKLSRDYTAEELAQRKSQEEQLFNLSAERLYRQRAAEEAAILENGKLSDALVQQNLAALNKKYGQEYVELRVKLKYYSPNKDNKYVNPFDGTNFAKDIAAAQTQDISVGMESFGKNIKGDYIQNFLDAYKAKIPDYIKQKQELDKILAEGLKQLQTELTNALITAPVDLATGIGEALGGAFKDGVGKSLANAGESVLRVVGGIIKKLGVKMVAASKIVMALQKSWATILTNPPGSLIIGLLAIAIGTALQAAKLSSQEPIKAFADGGIVTGPTLGLVGEAGREAIIPLDRFDEVVGNRGTTNVFVTGQLNGEIIYLQQQRASQRRGRYL